MDFGSILSTAVGFAGTAASGGIIGIIGSIGTGILSYFKDKNERAFQLEKMAADREMVKLEAESAVKVAESQAKIAENQQDGQAFADSQRLANQTLISPELASKANPFVAGLVYVVECLLRLMRPGLTIYVLYKFSGVIDMAYKAISGPPMDATYAQRIWLMCVDAIIFMAMAAWGWWFASRDLQRRIVKSA